MSFEKTRQRLGVRRSAPLSIAPDTLSAFRFKFTIRPLKSGEKSPHSKTLSRCTAATDFAKRPGVRALLRRSGFFN